MIKAIVVAIENMCLSDGKAEKGQATIEYLVLYTAILIVLIVFAGSKTSFFANSYDSALHRSTNSIAVKVNTLLKNR